MIHINAAADPLTYPRDQKKRMPCGGIGIIGRRTPFFFGPLFMIAMFAICMIMMMWMMRGHRHGGSSALDILNERYARGEINQAEYEERRRVLRS